MSKQKDFIRVRGIGKIACRPALTYMDARQICAISESFPFIEEVDDNGEGTGKYSYSPEAIEYGFWLAMLVTMTDYDYESRDAWADIHNTDLSSKLSVFYAPYMSELWDGAMERVSRKAKSLEPVNTEALFNGVAKQLEGVDIADVLGLANQLSNMDGKEIVHAALETEVP